MTNTAVAVAKEIKIASPSPFTGDPEKTRKFLQDVELYIRINSALYDTDEKKIIFALSFMKGGTAVGWSESYINAALTASNFGTWEDFKKEIEKAFSPIDSEGTACLKLKYLKQGEKQPVNEHISQFCILISKCRITDNKALVDYFMDGLTRKLLEKIHLMQNMPTTIDEWYKTAAQLDGQYRRAQAITNQSRNSYTPDYALPPRVTTIKDPNAMDIDAIRLMQEEHLEHLQNKKCFICHQTGHQSGAHRGGKFTPPRNNMGCFIPKKTGADAYKKIHAIMTDLPTDEKDEALKLMEEAGF